MNEIQHVWNDIKNRNFIEAYIVLLLGLVILFADILGVQTENAMREITLAVLSVLIYLNIKERREYTKLSKGKDVQGISVFHPSRESMPKLNSVMRGARKEIILYAIKHSVLVHQDLGILQERVEAGCRVKILIMAGEDMEGKVNPNVYDVDKQRFTTALLPTLQANTKALREWHNSLNPKWREKVEIRKYWGNPTVTYTVIDKDEIDGSFMVEVLIPGVPLFNLPHYIIMRRDDEDSFKLHIESLNYIWNKAEAI